MNRERHLLALIADHFEPASAALAREWQARFAAAAAVCRDDDDRPFRHTWFYDGDDPAVLDGLGQAARAGLGEVELHLHHGNDDAESLRRLIERRLAVYGERGALITVEGRRAYGFAHGKWALANSRGPRYCGVNDELRVLRETGCYADFTFPAWGRMQPRMINQAYFAASAAERPKSYDRGRPVEAGAADWGDLMILPGPGRLSGIPAPWSRFAPLRWAVDAVFAPPTLGGGFAATRAKARRWIRAGVGVRGRSEWVFVKLHCHGARPAVMTEFFARGSLARAARTLSDAARVERMGLHFVTAREAYNVARAAQAGRQGNPREYFDFEIKAYANARR